MPPPRPEHTRAALIARARAVARRRGTTRLTIGAFVAETGINPARVYARFDDWPTLCADARWEPERLEFEFRRRQFHHHGHDPAGCDVIVCWEDDWPDCPVEVLALKEVVAVLAPRLPPAGSNAPLPSAGAGGVTLPRPAAAAGGP